MALVKINDVSQGVNLDLSPEELQAGWWSNANNMRFVNGYATRFKGTAQVFATPTITPYWIAPYQTPTSKYWVHAGTQKVFVDDGTTRTEITPVSTFTGTQDDRWTGGTFSGKLVMNNGVDQPQYWDGNVANKLASLTGWNAAWKCDAIVPFKNYLVALGITKSSTKYPYMVKWSAASVPGALPASWDETDVTKDAGELDVAETPDVLVDALPLGDMLIVYKERSTYALRYIGQPYIFQLQRLPGDSGMMARGCGVNTPLGHVVLSAGDVVLVTPQGPQSIADGKIRKYIFNNIDSTTYKRAFVCVNPQKFEVLVCFPQNGSTYCNKAAVWNWTTQTWGLRDLPNATYGAAGQISATVSTTWGTDTETWALDATTWNENEYAPNEARLLFSTSTAIKAFDVGTSDDGVNQITGSLERTGMFFDDGSVVKLIKGIRPRIDSTTGAQVTVQVGASMTPDSAPIWSDPVTFTAGTDFKADTFAQGRYMAVRFSCSRPWRIRSFDIDLQTMGAY